MRLAQVSLLDRHQRDLCKCQAVNKPPITGLMPRRCRGSGGARRRVSDGSSTAFEPRSGETF